MIDERRHKRRIAVAYYRMSTDRQDKSIPEQRAEVEKLAEKGRYQIIREYLDEGISGDATKKRRAFQRMIADAKEQGDFEAILAWDQDRFGRFNSLEAGYWIYPLMCEGVRLVTVAQGEIDWNDFSGRIVYAVQQEAKFQFLVDLVRNSVRGLLARAQQGLWVGGRPPFDMMWERMGVSCPETPARWQLYDAFSVCDSRGWAIARLQGDLMLMESCPHRAAPGATLRCD